MVLFSIKHLLKLIIIPLAVAFALVAQSNADAEQITASSPVEAIASAEDKELCKAVTKRLRSASDPVAMIRNKQFADRKIFVHPQWQEINAENNIHAIRAAYVWESANAGKKQEEMRWKDIKHRALDTLDKGEIRIESASIPIGVYRADTNTHAIQKAVVYKITNSGNGKFIKYIIHQIEGIPEVSDAIILNQIDNADVSLYNGTGFFIETNFANRSIRISNTEYQYIGSYYSAFFTDETICWTDRL